MWNLPRPGIEPLPLHCRVNFYPLNHQGSPHICFITMPVKGKELVAQLCLTLSDPVDCSPPGSSVHGDFPGQNSGVGTCSLLQGIFPTQGSSSGLLHCKPIRYLSHQEETHEGTRS